MRRTKTIADYSGESVEEIVFTTVAEILYIDRSEILLHSHFRDDLDADSLDLAEMIVAFGAVFQVEIHDEHVQYIQTVGEAIDYLKERRVGTAADGEDSACM